MQETPKINLQLIIFLNKQVYKMDSFNFKNYEDFY